MPFAPVFDVAIWPLFLAMGLFVLCLLFPSIVIVEAIVLRLLRWGTSWRVWFDAAVANLVSGLFGVLIPVGAALVSDAPSDVVIGLVAAWLLSIAIEGGTLLLIAKLRGQEPLPVRRAWGCAAGANTASYVLLGIVLLALGTWF